MNITVQREKHGQTWVAVDTETGATARNRKRDVAIQAVTDLVQCDEIPVYIEIVYDKESRLWKMKHRTYGMVRLEFAGRKQDAVLAMIEKCRSAGVPRLY